ncbi:hypothetical protein WN50_27330 [Limnoraphis robusta CS-951]|uniref:Uncharacterized protein n=1 Tax=Limnoraphis robusta CS-951 TaxID=1637645 RepID=A0A0F5Y8J2_9CYAN|nr:hypothetical protein WN50_27330 [Limnoraphis robusta CS-951]
MIKVSILSPVFCLLTSAIKGKFRNFDNPEPPKIKTTLNTENTQKKSWCLRVDRGKFTDKKTAIFLP